MAISSDYPRRWWDAKKVERRIAATSGPQPTQAHPPRHGNAPLHADWNGLLELLWAEVRDRLLEESKASAALRQNAPL